MSSELDQFHSHYANEATSSPEQMGAFWMPFSANRQFKAKPRLLASAKGMFYRSVDGREILDGTGGLWCCNAGHGRDRIVAAVQQQIATMDFAPTFQMGHPLPFKVAERLAAISPDGRDHIHRGQGKSRAIGDDADLAI